MYSTVKRTEPCLNFRRFRQISCGTHTHNFHRLASPYYILYIFIYIYTPFTDTNTTFDKACRTNYHILGSNGKRGSHRRTTLRQTTVIQIVATIILGSGPAVDSRVASRFRTVGRPATRSRDTHPTKPRRQRGGETASILSRSNDEILHVGCEVRVSSASSSTGKIFSKPPSSVLKLPEEWLYDDPPSCITTAPPATSISNPA